VVAQQKAKAPFTAETQYCCGRHRPRNGNAGTVQVDLNLPGRLGAFYIDEHPTK